MLSVVFNKCNVEFNSAINKTVEYSIYFLSVLTAVLNENNYY